MIEKITFGKIGESVHFNYAGNLEFFKKNKAVFFKSGLNILFSPNGTGKSTIIDMIACATASKQGGISTLTPKWVLDMTMEHGAKDEKKSFLGGIKCFHDGQPVAYCNVRNGVGLIGGMMAFDDDFFDAGLAEIRLKESTGLTSLYRLGRVQRYLTGEEMIPDEYVSGKRYFSNGKLTPLIEKIISPKIEKSQKTIILDEPECGLSLHLQKGLWEMISKGAEEQNLQVIVATHSPFALLCDANFIELEKGYVDLSRQCISELGTKINKW